MMNPPSVHTKKRAKLRGVVLIVVLIVLGLLSLLAATSLHNAGSTESIAGNVRTTELANQSAEIALRHCESLAVGFAQAGSDPSPVTMDWLTAANWDKKTSTATVLGLDKVNPSGLLIYKRPPECTVAALTVMVTGQDVMSADGTDFERVLSTDGIATNSKSTYLITARGFGPEVAAADANRSRPVGTEVWLQSQIKVE